MGGGVVLPNVSVTKDDLTTVYYNPYVPPQPITYTASAKLAETINPNASGLHTDRFSGKSGQLTMTKHTFENGVGTIEFDGDVTNIGDNAFRGCSFTSITIPDGVTSIGGGAFDQCTGLTSITIPDSVTSIVVATFQGCSGLTSINIPNSVTSIGDWTFNNCSSLTSITIGSGVTGIGKYAFQNCSSLTSITIPDSVTSIGENAFRGCSGLTSITIGSGVTSIGVQPFLQCSNLFTITSHIMNAPSVDGGTFVGVKRGGTLYVPIGSSGYETWMNDQGNLGTYNWTKVEQ